jgi:hypothetical protein
MRDDEISSADSADGSCKGLCLPHWVLTAGDTPERLCFSVHVASGYPAIYSACSRASSVLPRLPVSGIPTPMLPDGRAAHREQKPFAAATGLFVGFASNSIRMRSWDM